VIIMRRGNGQVERDADSPLEKRPAAGMPAFRI